MLKISYSLTSLLVIGHVDYPKNAFGNDLVCAAVSAVVLGSFTVFDRNEVFLKQDFEQNSVLIRIDLPTKTNQIQLAVVIEQLMLLKKYFPKNISMKKLRITKGG